MADCWLKLYNKQRNMKIRLNIIYKIYISGFCGIASEDLEVKTKTQKIHKMLFEAYLLSYEQFKFTLDKVRQFYFSLFFFI